MTGPGEERRSESVPASREAAQRRADRIAAFRAELADLEREGVVALDDRQRAAIDARHEALLERLVTAFDVDRTEGQRRFSAGMRVATLLGALALASALYAFLDRFWGGLPMALQVSVLVALPLLFAGAMEVAARCERTLYVTLLLGLLAAASFVVGTPVLAGLLNVALPAEALLAWSLFCGALAYAYGLRLLLVFSTAFVLGWVGTIAGPTDGCVWEALGHRPEAFLPAGALLLAVPRLGRDDVHPRFAAVHRTFGLLALFLPVLVLGRAGSASVLPFDAPTIEAAYQLLGFVMAALTVWLGARSSLPEVTNVGAGAFLVYLYVKLYDWWWAFLPRWVFFLVLGLVAVALLVLLRHLHARSRSVPA